VKPAAPVVTGPPEVSLDHVVVSGEALFLIGKKYGVTVEQIKVANQMERDLIKVGQKLRIPSRAEVEAMKPPPPVEKKEEAKPTVSVKAPKEEVRPALTAVKYTRIPNEEAQRATQVVQTQAYLDRKLFSTGPIDGSDGSMHQAAIAAYKAAYPNELEWVDGKTPAVIVEMGGAYREYTLRAEDFRWIAGQSGSGGAKTSGKGGKDPDPTWEQLSTGTFLPYRSAWEYVAERFHCSEGFLRRINSVVKSTPKVGTLFLVPNVEPFEIDKAFEEPVRPEVDAAMPVVAKVLGGVWLEVRRGEKLVARVPVSAARPGLRGRGTWRILVATGAEQSGGVVLGESGEGNGSNAAALWVAWDEHSGAFDAAGECGRVSADELGFGEGGAVVASGDGIEVGVNPALRGWSYPPRWVARSFVFPWPLLLHPAKALLLKASVISLVRGRVIRGC
jgi:LysM repeat protein